MVRVIRARGAAPSERPLRRRCSGRGKAAARKGFARCARNAGKAHACFNEAAPPMATITRRPAAAQAPSSPSPACRRHGARIVLHVRQSALIMLARATERAAGNATWALLHRGGRRADTQGGPAARGAYRRRGARAWTLASGAAQAGATPSRRRQRGRQRRRGVAGARRRGGRMSGRARTRHDHNRFAARRRRNMKAGETLSEARRRWQAQDRCRDCGNALLEDGATGARCGSCRRGAGRRQAAQ